MTFPIEFYDVLNDDLLKQLSDFDSDVWGLSSEMGLMHE